MIGRKQMKRKEIKDTLEFKKNILLCMKKSLESKKLKKN